MEEYYNDLKLFLILGIVIGLTVFLGLHLSGRDVWLVILSYVIIGGGVILENRIKELENKVDNLEKQAKSEKGKNSL